MSRSRATFCCTVRRRAPSTEYSRSRMVVSRLISSSDSSRAFRCGSSRAWSHSRKAVVGPMPYRYRSEMCVGLSDGRSTPMIRGIARNSLALPLLVPRVGADDQQLAVAAHQLAILTNALDAGPNLHRKPLAAGTIDEYRVPY